MQQAWRMQRAQPDCLSSTPGVMPFGFPVARAWQHAQQAKQMRDLLAADPIYCASQQTKAELPATQCREHSAHPARALTTPGRCRPSSPPCHLGKGVPTHHLIEEVAVSTCLTDP